jgi:hypothetical protein
MEGMLRGLALILALQDATSEASGLVFTLPPGWTRRLDEASKATLLVPPDAEVRDAAVILYPTTPDIPGTAQEAHDKMLRATTAAGEVEGVPQTGTTGLFQWSRVTITLPGGARLRVALYSAKWGTTAGVAVFTATEAFFHRYLPDVERLARHLAFAGPPPRAVHGLLIPFPPGWTRKDASFVPPPGGDYVVHVLPSQPSRGTHWATHKALFEEALKASKLADPTKPVHSPDEPGPFIRSTSAGRDAEGRVRELSLYSARSERTIEGLLIQGQEDRDGLRPILARTTLKDPPKAVERPRVVEAYRRADARIRIAPVASLQFDRIWLRADGVADFTTVYPDGHAASPEVLKLDPDLRNGRVGAWKARGDTHVEITRSADVAPEVYAREAGRLRLGDEFWQPMPAVDGLRLDGRWGLKGIAIAFTKDGRYSDQGVAAHVDGRASKRSTGTYEIREWTLFLRDDDGTSWSTDFSTIGADLKNLSSILLRTTAFPKE